ncbi:MAG TPA: hypothetical protein VN892_10735 [Solirubrobacteraceae bacterium]|nr:hypothetical protein [Solirubrobacteraceae bacterium]
MSVAMPSAHHALAAHAGGLSTGAIVVAALAALVALGCVAWGVARAFAYEPRWVQYARHSIAEARLRTSSTCAELGDWMRLGR